MGELVNSLGWFVCELLEFIRGPRSNTHKIHSDGCSLCREHPGGHSKSGNPRHARIHSPPEASSSFCSAQTSRQGPLHPTLRANPFPKVTDLFCQLPLPALYYRPEATNLGDLMRLWVRPGRCVHKFILRLFKGR